LFKYVSIRLFFVNFRYIFKCLTKNVTHANILRQIKRVANIWESGWCFQSFEINKRISVLL